MPGSTAWTTNVIVLHPGPMLRGMEISDAVADAAQAVVLDQVTAGVHVRMAALFTLLVGTGVVRGRPQVSNRNTAQDTTREKVNTVNDYPATGVLTTSNRGGPAPRRPRLPAKAPRGRPGP